MLPAFVKLILAIPCAYHAITTGDLSCFISETQAVTFDYMGTENSVDAENFTLGGTIAGSHIAVANYPSSQEMVFLIFSPDPRLWNDMTYYLGENIEPNRSSGGYVAKGSYDDRLTYKIKFYRSGSATYVYKVTFQRTEGGTD